MDITRDTVEEKIRNLQQRKREIISATLDGEEELAEALTIEELRELTPVSVHGRTSYGESLITL